MLAVAAIRAGMNPMAVQVSRDIFLPVASQWYAAFFLNVRGSPLLPSPTMKAKFSPLLYRLTSVEQVTFLSGSGLEVVTTAVARGNFFFSSVNMARAFKASKNVPDSPIVVLVTTRSYIGPGKSSSTRWNPRA